MHKIVKKTLKATIINIIVALIISGIILGAIFLLANKQINELISQVNMVSIDVSNKEDSKDMVYIETESRVKNIPEYGTQYATISIPRIDANLPVYYGDTLDVLKKGVGHSSSTYFPGEGGSIIYMGHNSAKVFRRFSELKLNDEIIVETSYGKFTYKIYDMQLVHETETDKLPIQNEKEILMVYTCYPFNNIGYTDQRYVVYAELQK